MFNSPSVRGVDFVEKLNQAAYALHYVHTFSLFQQLIVVGKAPVVAYIVEGFQTSDG